MEKRRPVLARLRRVLNRLRDSKLELAKTLVGRQLHRWNNAGKKQSMILEVLHEEAHTRRQKAHVRNKDYFRQLHDCTAKGLGLEDDELAFIIEETDRVEASFRRVTALSLVENLVDVETQLRKGGKRGQKDRSGKRRVA